MSESVPLSFLVQHQEQLLQCAAFADACPLATNYLLHQQMGPFGLVVNIVALRGAAASPTPLRVHLVVDNHLRFPTASLQLTAAQFDLMREVVAAPRQPMPPATTSPTLWGWAFGHC
jgi:hypothetical protein